MEIWKSLLHIRSLEMMNSNKPNLVPMSASEFFMRATRAVVCAGMAGALALSLAALSLIHI